MANNFEDEFMQWARRPYWSPSHPLKYVTDGRYGRTGWGTIYNNDPGGFNLMWLLSGVGLPPDNYNRYTSSVLWVMQAPRFTLGRITLKEAAALHTINQFADQIFCACNPHLEPVASALRLRV